MYVKCVQVTRKAEEGVVTSDPYSVAQIWLCPMEADVTCLAAAPLTSGSVRYEPRIQDESTHDAEQSNAVFSPGNIHVSIPKPLGGQVDLMDIKVQLAQRLWYQRRTRKRSTSRIHGSCY